MYSQIFQAVTNQTFQGVFYGDSAVADFDNDGKTDFIISGAKPGYTGYTGIFKNNNGIFTENTNTALSQIMYSAIAVGDLNGDNKQDFIVTGTKTGENSPIVFEIYYNNGDGSFTKNTTSGIPGVKYGSVAIADLTNDGLPDIVVNGNLGSQYITKVFKQNQDGTFSDLNAGLLGTYFSAIKVFDANADGYPDILVTGLSTNYIPETKLYINSGRETFTEKPTTLPGIYISSIDNMDINGDGYPDLLISGTNYSRIPTLTIYTNDGSGNFTIQENGFTGIYNGNSKFIDYNNDGLIDIFSIGRNANNENTILLYKKNSNGTYTLDTENSAPIIAVYMSKGQWLDYDNDGDMDLLTIGFESDGVAQTRLYENKIINEGNLNTLSFNKNDFKLYPNPTEGLINILTREAIRNISLYNHLGQLIATQKQSQFNLENLANGIYMVRVDFENGQTANKKIIKK
ncbi:putative secreted protein (Por secretion system target) [Flavobacterium lindanitolerans]|uniref:Secreted protein (Por secretion system target) n=2 Tax=Flavobacterium lindanitolerans TaxID=428988 RepID=A0A497VAG1_9FLAO|nr:putative secreted protein (Por secretion system target) [Flavobacterium lindanitolerans]RLJ35189.1 putative secreted protein (Por secretion system target) [Flavobacterium lindanitolerans]